MSPPRPLVVVAATDSEWGLWRVAVGARRVRRGTPLRLGGEDPSLALLRTGVGHRAAADATSQLSALSPSIVLHVGFVGGLRAGLNDGDVVLVTACSPVVHTPGSEPPAQPRGLDDELLGALRARLSKLPDRMAQGPLLTVDRFVHRAADKTALGSSWSYLACDMEAAVVRRAAEEAGARYVGVRAVSDSHEHDVPPSLREDGGRLSVKRGLAWVGRPKAAAVEVLRLLRGGRRARGALGRAIPAALEALAPHLD